MSSAQHIKEPGLIMNTDSPAITNVNFFHEKYLLAVDEYNYNGNTLGAEELISLRYGVT